MAGRGMRVVATVLAAVVTLLLAGSSFRAEPAPSSCAAARSCVTAATSAPASVEPCLGAPSCGGGGAHVAQLAPAVAPGPVVVLAALALLGALRRGRERAPFTGRLAGGGLFRPPRPAV